MQPLTEILDVAKVSTPDSRQPGHHTAFFFLIQRSQPIVAGAGSIVRFEFLDDEFFQ